MATWLKVLIVIIACVGATFFILYELTAERIFVDFSNFFCGIYVGMMIMHWAWTQGDLE